MAKKEKWQPETAALSNNPFAALSGLKKGDSDCEAKPELLDKSPAKTESAPVIKLPKVKSSRLERAHHGGKTVTVVCFHGDPAPEAKQEWLKAMKKELGVGGMIEEDVVMLQGDQRERLKQ